MARGDDTWRSDLDLLVSFEPGWSVSDPFDVTEDLETIFGPGRVDVVSDGTLDAASALLREAVAL